MRALQHFDLQFKICVVVSLLSLLPLPFGAYSITRLIFMLALAFVSMRLHEKGLRVWWIAVGLVILYNPVFPIHLGTKILWAVCNICTCLFIIFADRSFPKQGEG